MRKLAYIIPTTLLAVPLLAAAQGIGDLETLAEDIASIIDILIPAAFGLALLAFFWGLAKYILSAGDEEAKEQGKRIMIGGVIAIFVAAAIWGIVEFLGGLIGVNPETNPINPTEGIDLN